MSHWFDEAIIYHIYPLGLCDAPEKNNFTSTPEERLWEVLPWLDHIRDLGANSLYMGPLFESTAHGYDTADYYRVDRRLGTNETLTRLSEAAHGKGIRLVLDGVFNHVGRDFWAFRDILAKGESAPYTGWFQNLSFAKRSPHGDPFGYEGWNGHYSLVKLNLKNPAVREHLFKAVDAWVRDFGIDGLRLDAADVMDLGFLTELAAHCRTLTPDFWLLGEVVHGDYGKWVNPSILDSVTNYECYKGLYSSLNDKNYFEIAYALNRQFARGGIYEGKLLYAFADNHDVDRVASSLKNSAHLYPLYCLLFTMPGVPSIYYGSEWGIEGKKDGSDRPLRPRLELDTAARAAPHPELARAVTKLAGIRRASPALRQGNYSQLHVGHEQLVFSRRTAEQCIVVALNSSQKPAAISIEIPWAGQGRLVDLLNHGEEFPVSHGRAKVLSIPPCWARVMELR
jgi:cyclomaltodextrinase